MTRGWGGRTQTEPVAPAGHDEPRDLFLALVAGHAVWAEGARSPDARERMAAACAAVGAIACAAAVWGSTRLQTQAWPWTVDTGRDARLVVACGFVIAAAAVLGRWYLRTAFGARIEPAPFWRSAAWRGTCFAILIVGLAVAFPNGQMGAGVVIGVLAGADLQLTLWALGSVSRLGVLIRQFILSPVHLARSVLRWPC